MKSHSDELACLEAILCDSTVYDDILLTSEDFEDPTYRRIFETCTRLIEASRTADLRTVMAEMPDMAPSTWTHVHPVTAANVTYYADRLKDNTRARKIATIPAMIHDGLKSKKSLDDLTEQIEQVLLCAQDRSVSRLLLIKDYLRQAMDTMQAAYEARHVDGVTGIPSGYRDIDRYTKGFHAGTINILAARTSIGKTTLVINMLENMLRTGYKVAFFSCEMAGEQIAQRMMASVGHYDHQSIIGGTISTGDTKKIGDAIDWLQEAGMYLDDTPSIPLATLKSKARALVRKGVQLVAIDYLTLIRHGDPRVPRYERIGEIVKSLKAMAVDLRIPVIALSQINREGEGQKPNLGQLRQSGEVEEDADVVMLLHREREASRAELQVAKNRHGPTGMAYLEFQQRYTRFVAAAEPWRES